MKAAQILREKINSGRVTVGALATMHFWPELVEVSRNAGLDYLIIDTEHMGHNPETIATGCALGRVMDFPVLIRPPEAQYGHVRLAADLGACGFLLPQVRSAATLDEVRDALYMPPRGKRRPGGPGNRWPVDYHYETWKREVEDDWIVMPQIESPEGLANADAIARHEITTAIAVGPYDLSASLGVCWKPESPELAAALATIRAAGRAVGKNMWMIGDGPTLVKKGFTLLCIAEPVYALEGALRASALAARAPQGSAAPAAGKDDKPLP
ncbi:MAG: aldolase/citrate lyase family protein [Planctomycetota bacterium]|nr:aldolase/citrate lyase family protein [Planctomycetota bacterium]